MKPCVVSHFHITRLVTKVKKKWEFFFFQFWVEIFFHISSYSNLKYRFIIRGCSHIMSATKGGVPSCWLIFLLIIGWQGGVWTPPFLADIVCEQPLRQFFVITFIISNYKHKELPLKHKSIKARSKYLWWQIILENVESLTTIFYLM